MKSGKILRGRAYIDFALRARTCHHCRRVIPKDSPHFGTTNGKHVNICHKCLNTFNLKLQEAINDAKRSV